jgi:O-antigen/teichoic acid export membrane protein
MLRAVLFSSIERYYGFVIAFVTTVVISRLLTPAEVGAFSVAMSVAGIASVFREFGASNFLIRTPKIDAHHESCAFGITLVLGIGLGSLLIVLAHPLAVFFAQSNVATLLYILSLNFFLLPFGVINFALIQRDLRFDLSARIGVIATTLSAAVSIGLAWLGFGSFSLAWGAVALSSITAGLTVWWGPGRVLVRPRLRGASELVSFGSKTTALTLIWEFGARFPEFIVGKLLGFTAAGLLSRATGLAANVNDLLMKGLQPVALPYFSRVEREGGDLAQSHYRIATLMTGVGWPVFVVLAVAAKPLTLTIYGDQWLGIVAPLQIICVQMAYNLLFSYQLQVVMVKNEMSAQVRTSLFVFPIRLILVAIGASIGVNETCLAFLVSQVLGTGITAVWLYPRIGVSIRKYLEIAWFSFPPALATLIGAIAGSKLTDGINTGNFFKFSAIGGLGFLAALIVLWVSGHPIRIEAEVFIRNSRWFKNKVR